VAFVGGIDLCHSRRDDAGHRGDPQAQPMASAYGPRPPWHDVQLSIRGPGVGDVDAVFRERWDDPTPMTRNPVRRFRDRHEDGRRPLPPQPPDPREAGPHAVQLLRTYPRLRGRSAYSFAPHGERSVARGYRKALERARRLVYLEDQYLWSTEIADTFAEALRRTPTLRLLAVVPRFSDQEGRFAAPPNLVGRIDALTVLHRAAPGRVTILSPENHDGVPVYVHAKVCIVDDVWATVGSDNVNRRSWTYDSELTAAVLDETPDGREPADPAGLGDGARRFARELRLRLAREHLDLGPDDDHLVLDPDTAVATFRRRAQDLAAWVDGGRTGPRPPGRLRTYEAPALPASTMRWARVVSRLVHDPDGRPAALRRVQAF
jgi:phosphatidylserine/phosphatidylglycerophosphate/cardiolipin synthase-like enzyme